MREVKTAKWADRLSLVKAGVTSAFFVDVGVGGSCWVIREGRWVPASGVVVLKDGGAELRATPRPLRERDIEAHLVKCVKELGGEVRKVQWVGRRGAPDRLVMLPAKPEFRWCKGVEGLDHRGFYKSEFSERRFCMKCGTQDVDAAGRTIWVELKAPGVEPEPHQLREHARMRAMGQRVVVIDSIEGVEELLR